MTFFLFSIIQPWTENLPSAFSMIPADVRSSMIIINIILIHIIAIIIKLFPREDNRSEQSKTSSWSFTLWRMSQIHHCSWQGYEAPPECVMSKENCLGIQVILFENEINLSPYRILQKEMVSKSSLLAFANFSSLHCWKIVTHRKGTIWSMTWAEGKP